MNNRKYVLEKLAFFAVTPFEVKSQEKLESVGGYARETGNRFAGSLLGATSGAGLGAVLAAPLLLSKNVDITIPAAAVLAGAGMTAGAITGDVRSLRKTEREAGVQPTGVGKYIGRSLGNSLLAPFPFLGDYLVSRHLTDYKKA